MITKETTKSLLVAIGIFLLLLFAFYAYNGDKINDTLDTLKIESASKVKIDSNNKKILEAEKNISELDKKRKLIEFKIDSLNKSVAKKENSIFNLLNQEKELHKKIDSYKTNEIANYFAERYKNPTAVSTLPYATVLQDTVGRAVVKDLVSYDVTKANIKIKNEIIKDKDSTIGEQKKIIEVQDKKIIEKDTVTDRQKNTISEQNKIAESQKTQIVNGEKNLKRSERKVTVGGIVILILTTFLILK